MLLSTLIQLMHVHFTLCVERVDFVDEMFRRWNDCSDLLAVAWKSFNRFHFRQNSQTKISRKFNNFLQTNSDWYCYILHHRFGMEVTKRITINSKCKDLWRLEKTTVCISTLNTFIYWSKCHINILQKLRYMYLASDNSWQILNVLMVSSPHRIN